MEGSRLERIFCSACVLLRIATSLAYLQPGTSVSADCPPPPKIDYGIVVPVVWDKMQPKIRYRCNYGYQLVGTAIHQCITSKWVPGAPPKCVQVLCPGLPFVSHGSWAFEGYEEGRKAFPKCDNGYELLFETTNELKCVKDGEFLHWKGDRPKCKVFASSGCQLPPTFSGGKIISEQKADFKPGEHVEIECDVGHRAVGGSLHLVCDEAGNWDDVFPKCQIILCKRPEIPANGNITPLETSDATEFPFAFEMTYICSQGYQLVGPNSRLCDIEGWTGEEPSCKLVRCEGTPRLENGHAISDRSEMLYYPGEELEVVCDIGYSHAGKQRYMLCGHDGEWGNFAVCLPILCDYPDVPANSALKGRTENVLEKFHFGDVVNYVCDRGYWLQVSRERMCEKNGWSGNAPLCSEITCLPPELPKHGNIVNLKEQYAYGENVTYDCPPRFSLWGTRTRTCAETGWTGSVPKCRVLGCKNLEIANGFVTSRKNREGFYDLGLYTTVACNHRYRLSGSQFIYCNNGGEWKGKMPSCIEISCGAVQHELLTPINKTVYLPGESLSVTCPEKFHPKNGSTTITCLNSGIWSDRLASCEADYCPEPPHIENGEVIPLFEKGNATEKAYLPGRRVTVDCDRGHTLSNQKRRNLCLENGQWEYSFPTCSVMTCGRPTLPENGDVVLPEENLNETFVYNSLAEYKCNLGYQLVGESHIRCGENGWSSRPPRCEVIHCPSTMRDFAGYIWLRRPTRFGNLALVQCNRGYRLSGNGISECMADGNWSRRPQTVCEAITCDIPDLPQFAVLSVYKEKYNLYDVVQFRCHHGFRLSGKLHLTCRESGWSDKLPECQPIEIVRCPEPPQIPHAKMQESVQNKSEYATGDRVNFQCNLGYITHSKDLYILCGANGSWDVSAAQCLEDSNVPCAKLPAVPNAQLKGADSSKQYLQGEVIPVECDSGYRSLLEENYVTCLQDGRWNLTAAVCEAVVCELPKLSENLSIVEQQDTDHFPFGFEINFRCAPGLVVIGPRWTACIENGWSEETPYCKIIKCYEPGIPEGGQRLGMSFDVGDKVTFSCFSGFTLIGDSERVCLPNGQWSGRLTRCNAAKNYCVNPGTPINGVKTGSKYMLGDFVDFRCKSGFTLVGPRKSFCLPNRQWRGKETKCLGRNEFDGYEKMRDVVKNVIETTVKRQADEIKEKQLSIQKPFRIAVFFVLDTSSSIGQRNFQITMNLVKAIIKRLGVTEDGIRIGVITFSGTAKVEFYPQQYNSTGDVLNALDAINYSEGGTKLEFALKLLYEDVIPSSTKHLNLFVSKPGKAAADNRLKSIAFVITDGKFNLADNPHPIARKLKTHVKFVCLGMTGHPRKDVLHSVVTSRADRIVIVDSYDMFELLAQNLDTNENDYGKCGIVSEDSELDLWPWAAYIADRRTNSIICRASLVSNVWILTSAFCLKGNSESFLTVYFDGREEGVDVSAAFVHPQFEANASDFDVALLKLKAPLEFSASLRPVCVPPSDFDGTNLYKENSKGYVTFGKMEENQSYYFEQNVALPIVSRNTCDAHLKTKGGVMSERLFCAGDGSIHADLCAPSQRGSPMLQFLKDEENRMTWVQVGIHSSIDQCATRSFYLYYTHVAKLGTWMDQIIQA